MGETKWPDLGNGGQFYTVTLNEREINAIHGAHGFLKGLGIGRPKVAADWMKHYMGALNGASRSLESQTEKGKARAFGESADGWRFWGAVLGAFLLGGALTRFVFGG